jgi:DNA-binding Lrp family transcriptional regulator
VKVIDRTDRQILHALQLAPRAAFARVGSALGVSEQTVARRYQRMRGDGLVRVVGRPDPRRVPGTSVWTLRIGCRPGTAAATAHALALRGDTSWVSIAAGGAELVCELRVDGDPRSSRVDLLHHLPRAANVLTMSAHQTLHRFVGRGEADWIGVDYRLDEAQRKILLTDDPPLVPRGPGAAVEPADAPLLAALARDGRATYAALSTVTGWPQRQVANRIAALTASGAIWFDVDAAIFLIGFTAVANLWFTVAPAHLASVGARLADHPEIAHAVAVTGSTNLFATAVCRDAESLYRYLTTRIAAIEDVRTLETVPILTRVKQSVCLVENGLLRDPPNTATRSTKHE